MSNTYKYLLIISLSLFVIESFAENYLVKTIDEFNSTIKRLTPGDTVTLANGRWRDASIIFQTNGKKNNPIILRSESPGKVILCGSSSLKIAGEFLIVDGLVFQDGNITNGSVIEFRNGTKHISNYSRLTNCVIESYNPDDKWTDTKWVSLYGVNNRVDHCYFNNKKNKGCLLVVWLDSIPDYHHIDSNYFGYREELGENGAEIIRIGTSDWSLFSSNTLVEKNYFFQCNGEREIISNKSCNNIFRYNTFVECQGTLTLRHGNNSMVEGNFFFGNNVPNTGGVRIIGENHKVFNNYFVDLEGDDVYSALAFMNGVPNSPLNRYYQVKNANVVFNTFVNCRNSITIGTGKDEELSLPPINSIVANNIIIGKNTPLIKIIAAPENFVWSGNIIYGANIDLELDNTNYRINPGLKLIEGIYRLTNESQIIKSVNRDFDFVIQDIDGQNRLEPKNVGCDQISEDPIQNKPMNKNDVGPRWKANEN
jgi:poly(beta-D-mannuronate) lyase